MTTLETASGLPWLVTDEARAARRQQLHQQVEVVYEDVTDGLRRPLRVRELVDEAARRHPDLLPSAAAMEAERARRQPDKLGLEIDEGAFVAEVLARPRCGFHLLHSMSQPTAAALERVDELRRTGRVDLGLVRVDRVGRVGHVTLQHHAVLNAEDDASTAALEVAVDLVLLDDQIDVGVLRGGPATHAKHAGRRIFGSGINLTHLYHGRISLLGFMLEREMGSVSKLYRGHAIGGWDEVEREERGEKPWIAVVDSFAIGGACQWLLVMDHVVAEQHSYFNLPARKEGIIPGCANLRLPRLIGERRARQAIFFDRAFPADSEEGRLLADQVVPSDQLDHALVSAVDELTNAGMTTVLANRRALRTAQEPLDAFRRYLATYAYEQALCLYSPALIANLERNWQAASRTPR